MEIQKALVLRLKTVGKILFLFLNPPTGKRGLLSRKKISLLTGRALSSSINFIEPRRLLTMRTRRGPHKKIPLNFRWVKRYLKILSISIFTKVLPVCYNKKVLELSRFSICQFSFSSPTFFPLLYHS